MDLDEEFYQIECRLAITLNRMYLAALARVYNVSFETMLIRHIAGWV